SPNSFLAVDSIAETAVLSAVLTDPEALVELEGRLLATDFGTPAHQAIFAAVLSCEADGVTPDVVTVGERLEKAGKIPGTVGPEYLEGLFERTSEAANLLAHAEVVRDRSAKRRVFQASRRMAEAAGSVEVSGPEAVSIAESEVMRLG